MLTARMIIRIYDRTDKNDPNKKIHWAKPMDHKCPYRPEFNLGGYLSSGWIITDEDELQSETDYEVMVSFPLIIPEAWETVQNTIHTGMKSTIQEASRILGEFTLLEYEYTP